MALVMHRSLKRWISLLMFAALMFGQASISLAGCRMERGQLPQALEPSDPCVYVVEQVALSCVAHWTSDLQLAGLAATLVRAPADVPVLFVPEAEEGFDVRPRIEPGPPGKLPHRILFQSFQI